MDGRHGPKLATAAEVARHLGVSPETIRAWYRRGLIPAMRAGQRPILFDVDAVKQSLARRADLIGYLGWSHRDRADELQIGVAYEIATMRAADLKLRQQKQGGAS